MSSAPTAKGNLPPQYPSILAAVLTYLVPGLGQLYQGRYGKGVLFMVSLLGMFMLGQAMGQWQNVYLLHIARKFDNGGWQRTQPVGEGIFRRRLVRALQPLAIRRAVLDRRRRLAVCPVAVFRTRCTPRAIEGAR